MNNLDNILLTWRTYKLSVPTFGAIILNTKMDKVLLVQVINRQDPYLHTISSSCVHVPLASYSRTLKQDKFRNIVYMLGSYNSVDIILETYVYH